MSTVSEREELAEVIYFLTRRNPEFKFSHTGARHTLRGFDNINLPKRASEEAVKKAKEEMGIDLTKMTWSNQKKFDKDRKTFILEHIWPVTDLLNECRKAKSKDEVSKILEKLETVWILRTEDIKLQKNNRADPEKMYEDMGIKLVALKDHF
ncbi:MAG: hypothetical protein FWG66_09380 [Spirochaetes bacterium]|nr:hypothetical protein [Spirochaetota bacterium]